MCGTPSVFKYLEHDIDKLNYKPLFISAGSKLSVDIQETYIEKGFKLIDAYGLTETGPAISIDNGKTFKVGSSGKILENVELKLENKDKSGVGEIFVKTENLKVGVDDWFDTGDLGKLEDGYLYILGRTKDVIVLDTGKKVFPQELEEIINKINGVKESLVYGDRLSSGKIVLSAKIVADESSKEYVENQLMETINDELETYKQIRNLYFVDNIEKNELGKIKRESYNKNEKENEEQDKENEVLQDDKEQILKSIIANQMGISIGKIDDESDLRFDLGCDSLDKAEIIAKYEEKVKTSIPKDKYSSINKVKDIANY